MDNAQKLKIFRAQTQNVREIEKAWNHINKTINSDIQKNNKFGLKFNTKILCITYCALAEAQFSKIIHTPHGLSLDHIAQIKTISSSRGVKEGWIKTVELALQDVSKGNSNHVPNVLQKLKTLIETYIFDPSLIRNKIAHGQWAIALNRDNDDINHLLTNEINQTTVVDLYRKKFALMKLSAIVEDIIESPDKAHHKYYWAHLEEFEQEQAIRSSWTMAIKIRDLKSKRSNTPNLEPIIGE